ncbi:helix-turn-helix domain-containing protein [Mycobacterium kansasii]
MSHVAEMLAQSAHSDGVPETQIADELGVNRMTVRKWLGKR